MPFTDTNDGDVFTLLETKAGDVGRDGGGFTLF